MGKIFIHSIINSDEEQFTQREKEYLP